MGGNWERPGLQWEDHVVFVYFSQKFLPEMATSLRRVAEVCQTRSSAANGERTRRIVLTVCRSSPITNHPSTTATSIGSSCRGDGRTQPVRRHTSEWSHARHSCSYATACTNATRCSNTSNTTSLGVWLYSRKQWVCRREQSFRIHGCQHSAASYREK